MVAYDFLVTTLGAAVILGVFSLVFYKDNPFSRWAEYSTVGLGAAYVVVQLTWRLQQYVFDPLMAGNFLKIVPFILGLLVYTQFIPRYRWVLRWPLAIISAVTISNTLTGIPAQNFIIQLQQIAIPLTTGNAMDIINAIIALITVLTVLSYFTFTHEHTGPLGMSTRIGRFIMMLCLGGAFGMTFISQGTFLMACINFLLKTWLGIL